MTDIAVIAGNDQRGGVTMACMTQAPAHAKRTRPQSDLVAAWLVLLGAGITMASFNIWHALHSDMPGYLAVLVGVAPVLIAMGLSHVVARSNAGWFLKTVTFLVMVGAMVLSVRATGYVVRLAFGNLWPLFGAVVDSAALVALQAILKPRNAAPEPEPAARQQARRSGTGTAPKRKQAGTGTRNRAAVAPEPVPAPKPEPVAADETVDLAAEARILSALGDGTMDTEKGILALVAAGHTPSRAGKLAGRSDSYGRKVVRMARDLSKAAPRGQDEETP